MMVADRPTSDEKSFLLTVTSHNQQIIKKLKLTGGTLANGGPLQDPNTTQKKARPSLYKKFFSTF